MAYLLSSGLQHFFYGLRSVATAKFFIGVDGGATHCRARIRAASGRLLADDAGPAANIYVDFDAGVSVMRELVATVIDKARLGGANRDEMALGVGLAGLSSAHDAARVAAALTGWARVEVANDAVTACIGANGMDDGGLIIAGTGTAGAARIDGAAKIVGGRGFLLGDDGSGARIGADAVRAALRAFDGLEPMSGLSRTLLAKFDSDPLRMMSWAQSAKPGDYGMFAPQVFEAARAGESGALEIVTRAATAIAAIFRRLEALGAERIAIVGGVAAPLRTYLPAEVEARLRTPKHDAVDGAILLVGGALSAPGELP
jgi:glucosamine kinase